MSCPRSSIVVNPAAGEQRRQLSPRRARVTVHGAGRGQREPQAEHRGEVRMTVVCGRMAITCNGRLSVLEAGQAITVAPGVEHAWWSTRAGTLCVEIEAEPEVLGLPSEDAESRRRRTGSPTGARRLTLRIAS
jgi:mannose-6-phosphate isomerase-like protein (cupin superfamily)